MPTYEITAPDGGTYEVDAPEGATEEEVLAYVKAQTGTEGTDAEPTEKPFNLNEGLYGGEGAGSRFVEGGKTLLKQARNAIFPPTNPLDLFASDQGRVSRETRERQADTAKAVQRLKSGGLGTAGEFGYNATEAAISAVPVARTGTAIGNVASRTLPAAAKRFAPAIGDVTANAAYSGGSAAAQGGSASDILKATLMGGAGAAVPHAAVGAAGAAARGAGRVVTDVARKGVGAEARQLLDEGIDLTPGQLGQGNWLTRLEEGAKSVPGLGKAIERAQGRAGEQYVTAEVNKALAPLEQGVKTTGRDALDEAHDIIDASYNKFVKDVHINPEDLRANLVKLDANLQDLPGLTPKQESMVYDFVTKRLSPAIERAEKAGTKIEGREFKNLDTELGNAARGYVKSSKASERSLGEALYEVQRQLRSSISPKRLGAAEDINKANQAFKSMLAIHKAGNREGGMFTPEQLRKVTSRMGEKPTPLNKAARKVLTKETTQGMNRNIIGGALGLGGGLGHAAGVWGVGTVAGKVLYSPRGVRAMIEHLAPEQKVKLLGVPEKQRGPLMKTMIANTPSLRQAAAQVGRELATDKENENAP